MMSFLYRVGVWLLQVCFTLLILFGFFKAKIDVAWENRPWKDNGSFRCWLLGHRMVADVYGIYSHCIHCGMPGGWQEPDAPFLLDGIRQWWWSRVSYPLSQIPRPVSTCSDCRKVERVLKWHVGNHHSCLPF
jgi:hypothetical protein